ncbi:MAG TPA: mandelate racemase/muconate lactonizing enzyme family protein [Stellaceae bacterium]|nr:mandelate racemase/muconate lactonizing enzyme family protein [Stellaceae bacterium]
MGKIKIALSEAGLVYPPGEEIHTAASGLVKALREYYLRIEDGRGVAGIGEIRANIAFITHTAEEKVAPGIITLVQGIDWSRPWSEILEALPARAADTPKISRALVENALVDGVARERGVTAAEFLGGAWRADGIECNQCVFWGSDENMRANAERYVAQGFRSIKLRIGIGTLEQDYARLSWLRDRFGGSVHLAVDANGAWTLRQAAAALAKLRPLGFDYIEQPTTPGNWEALEALGRETDVPIMLDEGLQSWSDVERLCANRGRISAHLKIAKAGGAKEMVKIGRTLSSHGVPFVVGQMNEGALATAIAIHCAMALEPMIGELYGALGILNDPATGVRYEHGRALVAHGPGTGSTFDPSKAKEIWSGEF